MPYVVTGSPIGPFGDAVLAALLDDGNLADIVADRIVAVTKSRARTVLPYIVGARRGLLGDGSAMGVAGGQASIWLDYWSEHNGPDEVQRMMARGRAVLSRDRVLSMVGFTMIAGSLACEEELVIADFDPDMPEKSLQHGVQKWVADVEEVSS